MPRIDPVQLLKCLGVLLSPSGGIKSKDEVQRLASLMTKFSKKLVSKCIYIQILKRTETELLGSFMGVGGWILIHMWLTDGIVSKNWPLIQELLELLLLCPVDVERLKTNNCPKLIKELSKETNQGVIQVLASKLVEQWLKLVKGEAAPPLVLDQIPNLVLENENSSNVTELDDKSSDLGVVKVYDGDQSDLDNNCETTNDKTSSDDNSVEKQDEDSERSKNQIPILKISVKDGKQVVSKLSDKSEKKSIGSDKKHSESDKKSKQDVDDNDKIKKKDSEKRRSSSSSSNSSRSSSNKSSKSKHSSKSNSSSDRHNSSDSSKSSSKSSKDKDRHSLSSKDSDKRKDKKHHSDRDRLGSDKSKEQEKNKDSSDKNKDAEKKENSSKTPILSIMKLGKIPKKSSSERNDVLKEKPSISIEVRKPTDNNRPKTVKTFNSKFRSHGLEEEAKPPPPRGSVKKPSVPATLPGLPAPKRPSPIRNMDAPPEKRPKIVDNSERPGAIKLIPAKPKPTHLFESGSFMDALAASATNKKEPRKRKRKTSGSKDMTAQNEGSPPTSPDAQNRPSTPVEESKPAPLRFYQDTLDTEEEERKAPGSKSPTEGDKTPDAEDDGSPSSPTKSVEDDVLGKLDIPTAEPIPDFNAANRGLKGVLVVHKKRGPKKALRWRDSNLEDVQYFELDETERVNVTKTFLDMKQMEHINEREAFKKSRNLATEDFMEERTHWQKLVPIDVSPDVMVDFGKNSQEKIKQSKRQASVLQALYFHKSMIPDSPAEADPENLPYSDPTVIPLDDVTGNPDTVNDYTTTPWPEPKTNPQSPSAIQGQQMFPPMPPFNPGMNGPPFGMAGFPPGGGGMMPGMAGMPGDWPVGGPGGPVPDGMGMNPDMFMGPVPNPMYHGMMQDYPMMEGMNGYQQGFPGPMGPSSMSRPMGPPGPGSYFGKNRGSGMRGPPRGGHGMHWRAKTPGSWNGPQRGGNSHRGSGRICTHFQKKGFCRFSDTCPFMHSNGSRY